MKRAVLLLLLFLVLAFSLATWLQPGHAAVSGCRSGGSVMKIFFGESRRLFANHLAVKADVYLHSGFYPSIFDQASQSNATNNAIAHGDEHTDEHHDDGDHDHNHAAGVEDPNCPECHHCDTSFMGPPRDWIEKMSRNFKVTEHSHLEGDRAREILPWLKFSAELDPQRLETYTVAAYWLSERLNKPAEAEQFLRQGLRENPSSYEILFDLGRLYDTHLKQPDRARGVWKLALRRWDEVEAGKDKPDKIGRSSILSHLGDLEARLGNWLQAASYFEEAKKYSPSPEALNDRINDLWQKQNLPPTSVPVTPH
ncbi:MAG: hypothetical protein RLY20_245 [Verrucomicrobiota bacterium]|jgi:tetratricopeptide (TPR) repeat protein